MYEPEDSIRVSTPQITALPGPSAMTSTGAKRVLIFSPDADLARTLVLILEDRFHITRETTVAGLTASLEGETPQLVLVDLFTFSEDVRRMLDVLREKARNVPLIILRGYIPLRQDVNDAVESMGSKVFYKPVDVDLVSQAIEHLLRTDAPQ